jgi:hypothetical protein
MVVVFTVLTNRVARALSAAEQHVPMLVDIGLKIFVEVEQIWKDQAERLLAEEWSRNS